MQSAVRNSLATGVSRIGGQMQRTWKRQMGGDGVADRRPAALCTRKEVLSQTITAGYPSTHMARKWSIEQLHFGVFGGGQIIPVFATKHGL